jgi:hypothetical protein
MHLSARTLRSFRMRAFCASPSSQKGKLADKELAFEEAMEQLRGGRELNSHRLANISDKSKSWLLQLDERTGYGYAGTNQHDRR